MANMPVDSKIINFSYLSPLYVIILLATVFRSGDFAAPEALGITILIEDKDGFNAPQIIESTNYRIKSIYIIFLL